MDCSSAAELIRNIQRGEQHSQLWQVKELSDVEVETILEAINQHNSFTHLGFFRCGLSTKQVKMICEGLAPQIRHLLFQYCSVCDKGAVYVAQLLTNPRNSLSRLFLCDDEIGDTGAGLIIQALRTNRSLGLLCMTDTLITSESLPRFREMVCYNTTLSTLMFPTSNLPPSDYAAQLDLDTVVQNPKLRQHWQRILAMCYLSIDRLSRKSVWKGLPLDVMRRVKYMLC